MEISTISDKEFKVLIIKMLTALERREEEHSKTFNKDIENIKNNQSDF